MSGGIGGINPAAFGSLRWREPVDSLSALNALTSGDNSIGDVRQILDTNSLYTWSGSLWIAISGSGGEGSVGPQGPQGPKGDKGGKGDTGNTGATGAAGSQGVQGVAGAQGAAGTTGAQGSQGSQGLQGPQGSQGATGPAPSGTANLVLATPDGGNGVSSLRSLVSADLPVNVTISGKLHIGGETDGDFTLKSTHDGYMIFRNGSDTAYVSQILAGALWSFESGAPATRIGTNEGIEVRSAGFLAWAGGADATQGKDVRLGRAGPAKLYLDDGNGGPATLKTSGLLLAVRSITTDYTVTINDSVILCDASAGPITIALPDVLTVRGQMIRAKKIDSSANSVTFVRTGSDTIDGGASLATSTRYAKIVVLAPDTGSDWAVF